MLYTLMHKKVPVADVEIDSETANVLSIPKVHNIEHLPVGIEVNNGIISRKSLNDWWFSRCIPASRSGLREALEIMGVYSTRMLLEKSFGLSLSDQYWINKHEKPLYWDRINFFENEFSEDVGNALFEQVPEAQKELDLISPDNTSDGWLKKRWLIIDGKRMLLKGESNPYNQEPLNEVLATKIMQKLNIPCAVYSLTTVKDKPMSLCEDFITPDTELISAYNIMLSQAKKFNLNIEHIKDVDFYEYFIKCSDELKIPNAKESIDQMLVIDFIMANKDRHFNNFGAVRNANTLEWIGLSPIFDTGTSLWYYQHAQNIEASDESSKPFKNKHSEQIKLVKNFDWMNFDALKNIEDEFRSIYKLSVYIDKARVDKLLLSFRKRVEMLKEETR